MPPSLLFFLFFEAGGTGEGEGVRMGIFERLAGSRRTAEEGDDGEGVSLDLVLSGAAIGMFDFELVGCCCCSLAAELGAVPDCGAESDKKDSIL